MHWNTHIASELRTRHGITRRVTSVYLNDTSILYHSVRNSAFVYVFNLKREK